MAVDQMTADLLRENEALRAEVERLREREAGLLEQHSRDSATLRTLCAARNEQRDGRLRALEALAVSRAEVERLRVELEPAEAEFEVVEDDADAETQCAYITGPREQALREAMHYAAVYSKDGPVKVREVIRRDIPMEASNDN